MRLWLLILFLNANTPAPPKYVEVKAGASDDVTTVLERYGLDQYACNIDRFFEINGIKEDYSMKPGRTYKLPIEVVEYNGKSIRSTLGTTDWQVALRIQEYNDQAVESGLRNDDFRVSKLLWVPWHAKNCPLEGEEAAAAREKPVASSKPAASGKYGTRSFPLFGKNYANTPIISQHFKGKVFYVVSGHGGPDVGAQGSRSGHTLCEDEYAYDVALRLVRLLVSHGATAYMIVRDPNDGIRDEQYLELDKDEVAWGDKPIPLDQKERLQQRCDIINELTEKYVKAGVKSQTFVEIHVDSRTRNQRTDVFFYYRPGSEPSKALAERMHKTFLQKYLKLRSGKNYNGTVSARDLYMLRNTTTPKAVYIEMGNIRNDWDQLRLVDRNNRQALANWILEGLW